MRTCTLIFTLCLFCITQVKGQKLTAQKIKDDMLVIDDMLSDLEGYKNVDTLEKIIIKYKEYWNTSIGTPNEGALKEFYEKIGKKLIEFSPRYDSILNSELNILKKDYIKSDASDGYYSLKKRLNKLSKKHKKIKVGLIEKIKINNLSKQYKEAGGADISIGDILREGGELLMVLDGYADRFGKLDSLSDAEMDSLKANPIDFISEKTDEHIEKYRQSKDRLSLLEIQTDLLQDYQNTISELNDSIERENDKFFQQNETLITVREVAKNELLASTNKQIQLNEELTRIRSKLSRYEQQVTEKANEHNELSEDTDTLSAMLESALNDFASAQNDIINLKAISEKLEADTTALQTRKVEIETKNKELEAQKAQAENGRLIFLISSIVLLLGLLSFVLYGQWLERKKNQRLLEEKALLEKNSEYTESFYDEYRKTTKVEIAIQREELKKKTKQLEVMLRELNHRTKNNLQMISSILGIQAMKIDNKEAKEVLKSSKSRIHALGLIHKGMYTEAFEDDIEVQMQGYINGLINTFQNVPQLQTKVKINKQVENISIKPDKAISIALIINEVVTNAFKHAFVDHPNPQLNIEFGYINKSKEKIYLIIEDNGKITTPVFNGKSECPRKDTMGTLLVKQLTDGLEGKCYYDKKKNGLKFILKIPTKNLKYSKSISLTI